MEVSVYSSEYNLDKTHRASEVSFVALPKMQNSQTVVQTQFIFFIHCPSFLLLVFGKRKGYWLMCWDVTAVPCLLVHSPVNSHIWGSFWIIGVHSSCIFNTKFYTVFCYYRVMYICTLWFVLWFQKWLRLNGWNELEGSKWFDYYISTQKIQMFNKMEIFIVSKIGIYSPVSFFTPISNQTTKW